MILTSFDLHASTATSIDRQTRGVHICSKQDLHDFLNGNMDLAGFGILFEYIAHLEVTTCILITKQMSMTDH